MSSPRILIVRLSAFGDCVLTMPMLCALRRRQPQAHIAWLTQSNCAPVIEGHPCLNEVLQVDRRYLRSWSKLTELRRRLREQAFDITIDPQGLLKSSVAAWLTGAPQRIGFTAPLGREGSTVLNNTRIRPQSSHIVERQCELLTPLGGTESPVEFRTPVDAAAEAKIRDWMEEQQLATYCVFNPGAAWPSKCWPLERYAATADQILAATGARTVAAWGGKQEQAWAEQLVSLAPNSVTMAPPTDLRELASLLRRAAVMVASDTGPLHLAAAVGAPCVGIYGPTRPSNSRPYGPQHIVLQKRYHEGSSRERRTADNSAICLISAEEVADACCEILARPQQQAA